MITKESWLKSIMAGICIGVGGIVYLSLDNKMVGAALFASGLFTICTLGYNLFTGKACYLPGSEQKGKYLLWLLQIWVGNLVGAAATGYLIRLTRAGSALAEKAQGLCETKLSDSLLSIFILAVFCNLMIYIAVENFKRTRTHWENTWRFSWGLWSLSWQALSTAWQICFTSRLPICGACAPSSTCWS